MLAGKHSHQRNEIFTQREEEGMEEKSQTVFLFYFLIPTRLMKSIFGFHIC